MPRVRASPICPGDPCYISLFTPMPPVRDLFSFFRQRWMGREVAEREAATKLPSASPMEVQHPPDAACWCCSAKCSTVGRKVLRETALRSGETRSPEAASASSNPMPNPSVPADRRRHGAAGRAACRGAGAAAAQGQRPGRRWLCPRVKSKVRRSSSLAPSGLSPRISLPTELLLDKEGLRGERGGEALRRRLEG